MRCLTRPLLSLTFMIFGVVACSPQNTTLDAEDVAVMDMTAIDLTTADVTADLSTEFDQRVDMSIMPDRIDCVDWLDDAHTCTQSPRTPDKYCCPVHEPSCDAPVIGGAISAGGKCNNAPWDAAPVGWKEEVDEHGCAVLVPGAENCFPGPEEDMPADMLDEADMPAPSHDFTLVNTSQIPVYIQIGDTSEFNFWQVLRDNKVQTTGDECGICNCVTCPSCAACGRAIARVQRIDPGTRHGFNWDRLIWDRQSGQCNQLSACESSALAPTGDYTMRVTYSKSFTVDTELGADDELIGPPNQITAAFALPFDGPVELSIP